MNVLARYACHPGPALRGLASSEEVMDLVSALTADILRLSIMSDETAGEEEDMGVYHDDMD